VFGGNEHSVVVDNKAMFGADRLEEQNRTFGVVAWQFFLMNQSAARSEALQLEEHLPDKLSEYPLENVVLVYAFQLAFVEPGKTVSLAALGTF
jgi:hypothetical protein